MVDPWPELGIGPTSDVRRIKKAYAARLKQVHPEDDAEGFQRLREAYEAALAFARWGEAPDDEFGEPDMPRRRSAAAFEPPELAAGPQQDAEALLGRVERLHADPERRAREAPWRELLASEPLWNVDARHAFESALIAQLLQPEFVLAPAVWALLQQEFHWTEQSLSFDQTLPREVADGLLHRLAQAPIEFGSRLCDEGRYDEARALVATLASGRPNALSRSVQRLLARCAAEETADGIMRDVERLRGDERCWTSVAEWRALLESPPLRKGETRRAFQRKLFELLATRGQGLTGPVWLLLDAAHGWTQELPDADLARAARALGPALAEAAEELDRQGNAREVVTRLARVMALLDGDAGRRARAVFERSCLALVERAVILHELGRFAEAVEEVAAAAGASGELGDRARSLLERSARSVLERAERLAAGRRPREAIEHLEPVVASFPVALATEGRLVLARCHVAETSYAKAEDHLTEALRHEPASVPALLLMAVVQRARGQLDHAASACQQVLGLDPANERAARELSGIEQERRQAETPSPEPQATGGPGFLVWIALLATFNTLRSCGTSNVLTGVDATKVLAILVVLAVAVALVLILVSPSRSRRSTTALDLHQEEDAPAREGSRRRVVLAGALAVVVLGLAIALVFRDGDAPTPSRVASPASSRPRWEAARAREVRIVSLGPTESLPLKPGRRIVLWATAQYSLVGGPGVVKLFARDQPGGSTLEVASLDVDRLADSVRLAGPYEVPRGAQRIDIVVALQTRDSPASRAEAHAFLAVAER